MLGKRVCDLKELSVNVEVMAGQVIMFFLFFFSLVDKIFSSFT